MQMLSSKGMQQVSAFVVKCDCRAVAFWNRVADRGFFPDPRPKVRYIRTLDGEGGTNDG